MFIALLAFALTTLDIRTEELSLDRYYRVNSKERFDLSGLLYLTPERKKILKTDSDFILVNDKSTLLWLGKIRGREIDISPWTSVKKVLKVRHTDLEGLDWDKGSIYVVNETGGEVVAINPKQPDKPELVFRLTDLVRHHGLSSRFGIEGIGVRGTDIFLSKEMPNLRIFRVSITKPHKVLIMERSIIGSQTAIRIRENMVFILDREQRCIWAESLNGRQVHRWSFAQTINSDLFRYVVKDWKGRKHPDWSTAEALDLTEDEIFVGLDNNDESLERVKDQRPSIMVFKRPS